MFASRSPDYLDDDLIGTDGDARRPRTSSPATRCTARSRTSPRSTQQLRRAARRRPAAPATRARPRRRLRVLARSTARASASTSSRSTTPRRRRPRTIPTWAPRGAVRPRLRRRPGARCASDAQRRLRVTVPPLSAVVYALAGRIPRSERAPSIALARAGARRRVERPDAGRARTSAATRSTRSRSRPAAARGGWQPIGTDDNAPYRVFHDVSGLHAPARRSSTGRPCSTTRATRAAARRARPTCPPPALTWDAPRRGLAPARQRAAAAVRRPGARDARGRVRAQRGRRRLGGDRHRQLVARLLDHRRHLGPGSRPAPRSRTGRR